MNDQRLRFSERPRIVLDLDGRQELDEVREELLRIADEFGWQFYDLRVSRFVMPDNPKPSGGIISSRFAGPWETFEGRTFDFPVVRLASYGTNFSSEHPTILAHKSLAGAMAVEHFVEAGFRNLLIFHQNTFKNASPVYRAAVSAAEECGMAVHRQRLTERADESPRAKRQRWAVEMVQVVSSLPKPLAYVGASDYLAANFCHVCQSSGIAVPEDVAVVGVGNIARARDFAPVPLSSIDLNEPMVIRKASEVLKGILGNDPVPMDTFQREDVPDAPLLHYLTVEPKGVVARRSSDMLAVEHPAVSRALRYMWDNLDCSLSVDDICREVAVSKPTLYRLFKKNLGRGINAELQRKRLETCCEMLKTTEMDIARIRESVGFTSSSYFYRTFQKAYGLTPAKYRARERDK